MLLRNHPSTEIEISYEDQPNNDYKVEGMARGCISLSLCVSLSLPPFLSLPRFLSHPMCWHTRFSSFILLSVTQSLFFHVQGLKAIDGVVPYLKQHKGVFVTASGTGFYEQCFPSNRCVYVCVCSANCCSHSPANRFKSYPLNVTCASTHSMPLPHLLLLAASTSACPSLLCTGCAKSHATSHLACT